MCSPSWPSSPWAGRSAGHVDSAGSMVGTGKVSAPCPPVQVWPGLCVLCTEMFKLQVDLAEQLL